MGKNISVYATETTLKKLEEIISVWTEEDKEDNWEHNWNRSDVVAYAVAIVHDIYVKKSEKLVPR